MTIGEKIKELRIKYNLTQKEVSETLNIKQNSYSNYENNKREPDINTLIKIANIFNTSLDYICGRYKDI